MPSAFESAFSRVQELVADFRANEPFYQSASFSEAQARKDFIDKFFIALGWDVNHDTQKNPYEQEVKVERNESGSQRRADYAFFLLPNFRDVRFFVEAKKPHGDFGAVENYFQTIRYGWGNKTPLAVLTNFDELHILDCRYKPNIGDTLSRVVERFSYTDYADSEKFAKIYWLFSREAVANNSLAKFADNLPRPKSRTFRKELFKGGYQSIDESFLIELDEYRETLAKAFKAKNPSLNSEQLTEVTQRTLDRLVFIRFLEDKLIEPQRRVERFGADGGNAWEDFIAAALGLDRTYNGIVFKRHDILDAPGFEVDDKAFRRICESLADPTSPYNFDAIPIHILGSIYERFLGKVITDSARVVEKPEVRKAGGVYYTPDYIVRYIVENTVGRLIDGKTPAQIAEMRFADIACGSGSFLLGVFDLLLRYHTKFYNDNPGKAKKSDCIKRDGALHLSLQKKQDILRNNIYGVDIDRQAVEVAQLSLYLKLLEDETLASAHAFQTEFHYTLLPSLTQNIVCGNSLIGTDILAIGKFTPEEEKRLNPMDYEQRFPEIMKRGGFDAIVGNPPYIPIESMSNAERGYFQTHFEELERKYDSSAIFVLAGIRKLIGTGRLGFISSITWQTGENYSKLRKTLFQKAGVNTLVNLPFDVFKDAYVDTGIYILSRKPVDKYSIFRFPKKIKITNLDGLNFTEVDSSLVTEPEFKVILEPAAQKILLRVSQSKDFVPFGEFTESTQGLAASFFQTSNEKKNADWYPFAGGTQMYRYEFTLGETLFANLGEHPSLKRFYDERAKLLLRRVINRQDRLDAMYYEKQMVFKKDINPFVFANDSWNPKYVLGIINSRLISFLYVNTSSIATKDDFRQTTLAELRRLPIRKLDFKKRSDKSHSDKLVALVEQLLSAKVQLAAAQSDADKDFYGNKCATSDRQIDALVYELYGLTADEIKIVESTT